MTVYMNGLRSLTLAAVIGFILVLTVGCVKPEARTEHELPLTHDQVESILKEEGLDLIEVRAQSPVKENIPITPKSYTIGEENGKLFVYQFDTIAMRKEYFPFSFAGPVERVNDSIYLLFVAKNVAIICGPVPRTAGGQLLVNSDKLIRAVFYEMHEIQEEDFQGQGDYWDVSLDLEFFEYEWEDNKGEQQIDFHQHSKLQFHYLGSNPKEVSEMRYTCYYSETGKVTQGIFSDEGFLDEHGAWSESGAVVFDEPIEQDVIEMIIEWNGNEERIKMLRTR